VVASGQLESIVGKQIAQLVALDLPAKIVRVAKADHVFWKKRLADMMAGIVQLRVEELADHRGCRLGRWYYSDHARCARHLPAFGALEDPHAAVHAAGMAAVAAFNKGDVDGAMAHIARVEVASVEVLRLLCEVERGVVAAHTDGACA
jgi:methyl-accepting chemotaxis protein